MKHYNRAALNTNMDCPYCADKKMSANGCGGKGMKIVNSMLGMLPSSKLFYGACCLHDITYALVSIEAIQVTDSQGKTWTLRDREDCDNIWLDEMLWCAGQLKWKWHRKLMRWAAKRNYRFVREKGDGFFKHEH